MSLKTSMVVTLLFTVAVAVSANAQPEQGKPAKVMPRDFSNERAVTTAISGLASSARHCIGPSGANVHTLGWVPSDTEVHITFLSDFDPVAAMTVMQMGQDAPDRLARASYLADDDGGGNLEPEILFRTSFSGTLNLHVSKFSSDRQAGCYFFKVEIRTP